MTETSASTPSPDLSSSPYQYAAAPDIIRAHQKDAYFQGLLTNQLTDLHRRLLGARSAHAWAAESRTAADLLYLGLTTLLGNRTLGEEYCDLVQVEAHTAAPASRDSFPRLPSLARRAAYISSSILLPYALSRLLPTARSGLRARLTARVAALARRGPGAASGAESRVLRYVLSHLGPLTSGTHIHAATLAVFYFTGAYYSLAKRATGLRYVFTRAVDASSGDRAGYEVLGVLLAAQLAVQAWLHVRAVLAAGAAERLPAAGGEAALREREWAFRGAGVDVSLDENAYSSNNELLLGMGMPGGQAAGASRVDIAAVTHTPVVRDGRPRFDLRDAEVMSWIRGQQQRKCTLCLEELKDPAATQCGHVFCWTCIGDWVREKPECPLCRREAMAQHILPLRVV